MKKLNELARSAKKEYLFIKTFQIIGICLIIFLLTYFIIHIVIFSTPPLMVPPEKPYFPVYEITIGILGTVMVSITWLMYKIPSAIQRTLVSYFKDLGCSTKRALFHKLKISKSSNQYFNVKIHLHKRVSDESCLLHLDSMRLPITLEDEDRFKMIGERYLLHSDMENQKYYTTCELEEVHLRGLFMMQALEEFLQAKN